MCFRMEMWDSCKYQILAPKLDFVVFELSDVTWNTKMELMTICNIFFLKCLLNYFKWYHKGKHVHVSLIAAMK